MANQNRMQNPAMMTSQSHQMHHQQFSQAQPMMQSHTQSLNTPTSNSSMPQTQPQATSSTGLTLQMPTHVSPTKETPAAPVMNTASLCRMGQESVQEIVTRMSEVFQAQKQLSTLPNGVQSNLPAFQERNRAKLEECLNQTAQQMRNLKVIFAKVVQACGEPGEVNESNYIPYEDDASVKPNYSREYQYASDELRDISEQVRQKNRQLKEVIDKLRSIVWEINTMMAMRYT